MSENERTITFPRRGVVTLDKEMRSAIRLVLDGDLEGHTVGYETKIVDDKLVVRFDFDVHAWEMPATSTTEDLLMVALTEEEWEGWACRCVLLAYLEAAGY